MKKIPIKLVFIIMMVSLFGAVYCFQHASSHETEVRCRISGKTDTVKVKWYAPSPVMNNDTLLNLKVGEDVYIHEVSGLYVLIATESMASQYPWVVRPVGEKAIVVAN